MQNGTRSVKIRAQQISLCLWDVEKKEKRSEPWPLATPAGGYSSAQPISVGSCSSCPYTPTSIPIGFINSQLKPSSIPSLQRFIKCLLCAGHWVEPVGDAGMMELQCQPSTSAGGIQGGRWPGGPEAGVSGRSTLSPTVLWSLEKQTK